MTLNLGIVRPGSTILVPFHTFTSDDPSASVAIADFVLADIGIYKGTSMTERASTTGVVLLDTDGIDVDAAVGIGGFSIDLSSNATAGFYSAGSHYYVTVGPVTIDGAPVNFVAATFSIGYPDAIINTTIASVTDQTQFILTAGPAEADVLIGCPVLFHDVASAVQLSIGYITDYIVTTKEVFIAADPGGFTFVATDNVSIFIPSNVRGVGGALQTAGDLAALIATADTVVDAIKVVTDKFAFTVANQVDANTLQIEGADATDTINAACDTSIETYKLDHLVAAADGDDPVDGSIMAHIVSATEDWSTFVPSTDSLQAVRDHATTIKSETALIVADTNELQVDDVPGLIATAQADLDIITDADGVVLGAAGVNLIWDEGMTETTGAPAITGSFREALKWMFALARNKILQTATTTTLRNDADDGDLATSTVSDDDTTYTRGEWST